MAATLSDLESQMRPRMFPFLVFGLVIAVGVTSFLIWREHPWFLSRAYVLRIATAPLTNEGWKLGATFRRELAQEHPRVSIEIIQEPDLAKSALALKNQEADVAVVRADDPNASEGRAIFVVRKLIVAVFVPAGSTEESEESIADLHLRGKRIGVLTSGSDIDPIARAVLDFYGFEERRVARIAPAELEKALKEKSSEKKIHALLVVGPIGPGSQIATAFNAFRRATKKAPSFLDLSEAEAITRRYPVYEKIDLPAGSFGGSPVVAPTFDTTSIAASVLLVARPSLSNFAAGELTRLLFATKTKIAASLPEAGQLVAPPTDRDAVPPAHPGTIAYLNGDMPDLLDETMKYIFVTLMFAGVFGALVAWLPSLRNRRQLRGYVEQKAERREWGANGPFSPLKKGLAVNDEQTPTGCNR